MFDSGNLAIENVRIHRELRRRRNDTRSRRSRQLGRSGNPANVWSTVIVESGNIDVVGNVDILRNAGHGGNVWNVRLRLK